jgi:hypothetical protein
MECFVCGKHIEEGFLCKEDSEMLHEMLHSRENIIINPDFRHHCSICGEYENRIVLEYQAIYYCDIDIEEEYKRHKSKRLAK